MDKQDGKITVRAFVIGILFAAFFAWLTVYFSDRKGMYPTATQVPVMPYVLLFLMVLAINPLCRLIRIVRRFSAAEILLVFMMGLISSGISTFGLTAQLVPVVGSLFNQSWNNDQTEWNRKIVPLLDDRFFLAVDGVGEAATDYAAAYERVQEMQTVVDLAGRVVVMEQRLAETNAALAPHLDGLPEDADARLTETRLRGDLQAAEEALRQARRQWNNFADRHPEMPPAAQALVDYRTRLEAANREVEELRERLRAFEEDAFAVVEVFRRGLPPEQRAFPGLVMQAEDTRTSYFARIRRTVAGHRVANLLDEVDQALSEADDNRAAESLAVVRKLLDKMADTQAIEAELEAIEARESKLSESVLTLQAELRRFNALRREAEREEIRRLEGVIASHRRQLTRTTQRRNRVREQRQNLQQQIAIAERVGQVIVEVEIIRERVQRGEAGEPDREQLAELTALLPALDGSWRRFLLGDVPWRHWWRPLWRWGLLIGLAYVVLMTFNVLIFRQWAHHEKLVYPLAQLPEALVGDDHEGGILPAIFRNPLFWVGFAVSGSFLSYNVLAHSKLLPGLTPLDFQNWWTTYIEGTALEGLTGGRYPRSNIFFTMIGLAFLIPAKVSFSLWFFSILTMLQVLIMVWLGHGQNEASFPQEWWYTMNFRSAEGAGALIVFSSVVLYKCRRYLFCAFSAKTVSKLEPDERRELRISSLLFMLASLGVILILWRGMGASLIYTLFSFLLLIIITVGLVRAVAEGGLLGFQAWANPFHLIRNFFGMDKSWTNVSFFAPIMVFYSVLFLDIKTFIAPAMANSLKIRDDLRMRRGVFHLAMFSAIAVAAVVAIAVSIMMAYSGGADVMNHWFYGIFPRQVFGTVANLSEAPPLASQTETLWVFFGAAAMGGLLYFRQSLFWLPHPIGMIMLVNPLMGAYWFSILLGWLAKSLVTKYGNKEVYGRTRGLFIGLIVGELVLVTVAMVISVRTGTRIPVDLNQN